MRVVQIGSGGDWLRLTSVGSPGEVTAELRCGGLAASHRVVHPYRSGFEDLADFVGQLADDWRGWSGLRAWESIEGDLRIEARHEYRHVQLRITLRHNGPGWGNDGWKAIADLTIDPGEELTRVAPDLQAMAVGCTDNDPDLDS